VSGLYQDPHWPRAGAWLRGELRVGSLGRLTVLGAPANRGSITPGRYDLAPAAIRQALDRYSTFDLEGPANLLDLRAHDAGDLDIAGIAPEQALDPVRTAVAQALGESDAAVVLGGDNSVTFPAVQALGKCGLITFDAHLDLRSLDGGLTNGNPIRALLANGFAGERIVQIGIQSFANSEAYWNVAREAGIRIVSADEVRRQGIERVVCEALESLAGLPVYVDLDLDVLDRAFAPATPGSRPGGLMPCDIRTAARLCGECARVRVLDLVEMDPTQDVANQTALAAAACLLSFASGVHRRCSRSSAAHSL
jgi:formiminoglutamase